jgi:hypothetical protein
VNAHPKLLSRAGLSWVGVVLVGLAAGGHAAVPLDEAVAAAAGQTVASLARGAVIGLLLGAAQALFLRGRIVLSPLWVPATIAGCALGQVIGGPFEDIFGLRTIGIPTGLGIGLGIGLFQGHLLRDQWPDAARWAKRNVAAFAAAYALGRIAPLIAGADPSAGTFAPAVAGLAVGIILWPAVGALLYTVHRHGLHRG